MRRVRIAKGIEALVLAEAGQGMTLVFGRSEVMEHVVSQYEVPVAQETTKKSTHPEVPDTEMSLGRNPHVMVVYDQTSQMQGMGTANCLTCTHFTANQPCPERPDHPTLDQATVTKYSVGGCIYQQLLDDLNQQVGHMSYANEKYDKIHEMIQGRNIVVWKNGVITQVPVDLPDVELEEDDDDLV